MINSTATVVLSTYNGGKYLDEQLNSLLLQDYDKFKVFIRDDGSSDESLDIIKRYTNEYPDIFFLIRDKLGNIGSTNSFYELLKYVDTDFVFFCDQDDIWNKDKVAKSLKFVSSSVAHDSNLAILTFTDLTLIDEEGVVISKSYHNQMRLNCDYLIKDYKLMLVQSCITGCTSMMNKKAYQSIINLNFRPSTIIHDHFISTYLKSEGARILYNNECTMMYRQHSNNQVGSKKVNLKYFFYKLARFKSTLDYDLTLNRSLYPSKRISLLMYFYLKFFVNINRAFHSKYK